MDFKSIEVEGPDELGAVLVSLADVEPQPIEWLWPARIAIGKLTLLAGDPGLGKSLVTLDIGAKVSRGAAWPDGSGCAKPGSVVLLTAEDDIGDTIRPRLDAARADVSRIVAIEAIEGRDEQGCYKRAVDLTRDLDKVGRAIERLGNCRLLIVDPISAYMGRTDSHKNAEVRATLAPLAEMAQRHRIAVLAVTHLRKGEGPALYRAMGSLAFVAAARAVWAVARDQNEKERRLVLPVKNNLAVDSDGLAYRVTSPAGVPAVEWCAEPVTIGADEALASDEPRKRGPEPEELTEAQSFLRSALSAGPRLASELIEEARELHNIKERTLRRAHKSLNVLAYHPANPGPWWWRLPGADGQADSRHKQLGNLGNVPQNTSIFDVFESPDGADCQVSEYGNVAGSGGQLGDPNAALAEAFAETSDYTDKPPDMEGSA